MTRSRKGAEPGDNRPDPHDRLWLHARLRDFAPKMYQVLRDVVITRGQAASAIRDARALLDQINADGDPL